MVNSKETKVITITNELIRSFNPCYDPSKYLKDTDSLSVVDFLKKAAIPAADRLWVTLRTAVLDEKTLRLHAVKCSSYAVAKLSDSNLKSQLFSILDVATKYALGQADDDARSAAYSAADSAADSAARSAADSAAYSAARSAAYSAADSAAYSAARSAAYSAADSAARSAADSAAYSAARSAADSAAYSAACSALVELLTAKTPTNAVEGVKYDQEKPDMSLLSPIAMFELAKVMTYGKKKYSANNWRGGLAYTRVTAAVLRHIFSWLGGESKDPETGLSHLAHASAGLMMLLEFEATRPELDDRYKPEAKDAY